jgi:hypothetical protein
VLTNRAQTSNGDQCIGRTDFSQQRTAAYQGGGFPVANLDSSEHYVFQEQAARCQRPHPSPHSCYNPEYLASTNGA